MTMRLRRSHFARSMFCSAALLVCTCTNPSSPFGVDEPIAGAVVTDDLARFWAAYDAGASSEAFQREYLDRATPGLRDFAERRQVTATALTQMVAAYPNFFAAVREPSLRMATDPAVTSAIHAAFVALDRVFPEATFPPTTLLIGRFSTAGTISNAGVLIGSEFLLGGPGVPTEELGAFQRAYTRDQAGLVPLALHEMVHIQQARAGVFAGGARWRTLLAQSLVEGIADFVAERVWGEHINTALHTWAISREDSLWREFEPLMHDENVDGWLYNHANSTPDRPGDLGYFVGHRIAKAYASTRPSLEVAVRELILMNDPAALLEASGYAGSSSGAVQ